MQEVYEIGNLIALRLKQKKEKEAVRELMSEDAWQTVKLQHNINTI